MEVRNLKVLLDTHAVPLVFGDPARLGKESRRTLESCDPEEIAISDFSLYELAVLLERGRIEVSQPAGTVLGEIASRITLVPLDADIALEATRLPLPHGDPFDRVIVATARKYRLPLITRDTIIVGSKLVKTIW